MGTMLIGYDVEWLGEGDVTPRFLEQARSLHNRLGVPATLFVVGQTLERWVPQFQVIAGDPSSTSSSTPTPISCSRRSTSRMADRFASCAGSPSRDA